MNVSLVGSGVSVQVVGPVAHLVIHTDCDLETWSSLVRVQFSRWVALLNTRRRQHRHRPFNVQIQDLQGRAVEEVVDASSLIDLPLAPGTYHVKAQMGRIQRSFTLTLQKDVRFDLFLYRAAASDP